MALEITDLNFEEVVLQSPKLSVIDFWAAWCGPCKMIAPIVEELSHEYAGKVNIGKIDVDTNPEIAMKYNIRSIPTLLFIKGDTVVNKVVGATTKANIKELIDKHI